MSTRGVSAHGVSESHLYVMTFLPAYVRLPHGVDQDEWLATHSELS